jgi:hypothetical protein
MTSIIKKAIPVTVGLLLLAGSPAFAAGHHTRHHVLISPRVAASFDAVPGWAESPRPSIRNDVPSYNDPSKFGGDAALPVQ